MSAAEKVTHTPGPWHYTGPGSMDWRHVFAEINGKTWCVAHVISGRISITDNGPEFDDSAKHEAEANCHLIAAAPEILEALEECMKDTFTAANGMDQSGAMSYAGQRYRKAQAAIRKAKGEQ